MNPMPVEPLRKTLLRTVLIAVLAGAVIALLSREWSRWPVDALLAFWITFGGHWVEVWFLQGVRPRIPAAGSVQRIARLAVWFVGGSILGFGMMLTARAFGIGANWSAWWKLGVLFIGVELIVHLFLLLRGQSGFFRDRRGSALES